MVSWAALPLLLMLPSMPPLQAAVKPAAALENPNGGRGVHGAPGPVAGVGLPSLILFGGIAYLVVRRRATPALRQ